MTTEIDVLAGMISELRGRGEISEDEYAALRKHVLWDAPVADGLLRRLSASTASTSSPGSQLPAGHPSAAHAVPPPPVCNVSAGNRSAPERPVRLPTGPVHPPHRQQPMPRPPAQQPRPSAPPTPFSPTPQAPRRLADFPTVSMPLIRPTPTVALPPVRYLPARAPGRPVSPPAPRPMPPTPRGFAPAARGYPPPVLRPPAPWPPLPPPRIGRGQPAPFRPTRSGGLDTNSGQINVLNAPLGRTEGTGRTDRAGRANGIGAGHGADACGCGRRSQHSLDRLMAILVLLTLVLAGVGYAAMRQFR